MSARMDSRTFTCPQCGATQRFDPATRTLSCPFCGTNLELDPTPTAPVDSVPAEMRGIVPFAISNEDALARLRTWLGKAFWSPNDLAARAAVDVTAGIYVPHYGFVLDVHANWTGAYAQTHYRTEVSTTTDSNGTQHVQSREVPYTVWYPESGQHDGTHSTLVCASQGLTQQEADALLPFDLNAARPDQSEYLAGFSTELPRFPVDEAWRSAGNARIDAQVRSACAGMTGQLRTYHWITEQSSETLLWLPIWMYRYRYGERFHRVVMNGQSGKISGARPVSPHKVGVAVLAVLIAALVLFTALHLHAAQAASATVAANALSFATETAQPTATLYPDQQTATTDAFPAVIAQAPPPAPTASSNSRTFTDAQGRFTLRYPATWPATTGADPGVVTFVTPDGLHISVSLFPSARTPLEQLKAIQTNRPTTRAYADVSVQLAQLPGGAAATMHYRSVGATNPADVHDGVFWVIASGNGTLIQIEAYTDGALTPAQQDAIAAMAQSVAFRS